MTAHCHRNPAGNARPRCAACRRERLMIRSCCSMNRLSATTAFVPRGPRSLVIVVRRWRRGVSRSFMAMQLRGRCRLGQDYPSHRIRDERCEFARDRQQQCNSKAYCTICACIRCISACARMHPAQVTELSGDAYVSRAAHVQAPGLLNHVFISMSPRSQQRACSIGPFQRGPAPRSHPRRAVRYRKSTHRQAGAV